MQDNLIFLGGPHGAGKTTLEKLLAEKVSGVIFPELKTRTPKFYSGIPEKQVDFLHRQMLKQSQRAIENYEYLEIAKNNPGKTIIANRCIYDVEAYNQAYFSISWISKSQLIFLNQLSCLYGSLQNPRCIILNPGFNVCKKHLEERWKTKSKKFMEEDMGYLNAVCNAYNSFANREHCLCINHEINLQDLKDINLISDWIYSTIAVA